MQSLLKANLKKKITSQANYRINVECKGSSTVEVFLKKKKAQRHVLSVIKSYGSNEDSVILV